jgi:hypothetical protein
VCTENLIPVRAQRNDLPSERHQLIVLDRKIRARVRLINRGGTVPLFDVIGVGSLDRRVIGWICSRDPTDER